MKRELQYQKESTETLENMFFGLAIFTTTCTEAPSHPTEVLEMDFTVFNLRMACEETRMTQLLEPCPVNGLNCDECGGELLETIEFVKLPNILIFCLESGNKTMILE